MKGFVLGLIVAALAFAGYTFWQSREAKLPTVSAADGGAPVKKKRRRGRSASRETRPQDSNEGEESDPEPIKISAADRKMVAQGDDLGRPEVVRMDMAERDNLPELSQDDIDRGFRAKEDDILGCISSARPDAEAYVPGLVNVKFRIQRGGQVKGVRVEAPSILHKGGIYNCVKGVLEGIRFPPSGSSQIVTYPFRLS